MLESINYNKVDPVI